MIKSSFNPLCFLMAALFWPLLVQAQMHRYNPNFTLSEKNFCDTIPVTLDDGQLFVDVKMGGVSRRFLLDTGSSQGMVYENAVIDGCMELGNMISHDANNLSLIHM